MSQGLAVSRKSSLAQCQLLVRPPFMRSKGLGDWSQIVSLVGSRAAGTCPAVMASPEPSNMHGYAWPAAMKLAQYRAYLPSICLGGQFHFIGCMTHLLGAASQLVATVWRKASD